jgi:hypothetical protein
VSQSVVAINRANLKKRDNHAVHAPAPCFDARDQSTVPVISSSAADAMRSVSDSRGRRKEFEPVASLQPKTRAAYL